MSEPEKDYLVLTQMQSPRAFRTTCRHRGSILCTEKPDIAMWSTALPLPKT